MKINISKIENILKKLKKKDITLFTAVKKKIIRISELKKEETEFFKNLKAPLNKYKRVHAGSFVLIFRVERSTVFFDKFEHHDKAYK